MKCIGSHQPWRIETPHTEDDVIDVLGMLRGQGWMCRGLPEKYDSLVTSFDWRTPPHLSRLERLRLERQSINLFRSAARSFVTGEEDATHSDLVALMVLRHYGVPTRLMDWSTSPFVAAYFAVTDKEQQDGEIWAFDQIKYAQVGDNQWNRHRTGSLPKGSDGFHLAAELEAFLPTEPKPGWFVCYFYNTFSGFPRQKAQEGAFSMTPAFGRDHADAIATLLRDNAHYVRYVIKAALKPKLQRILRDDHGVWRGSLFPDSAGAADTTHRIFFPEMKR